MNHLSIDHLYAGYGAAWIAKDLSFATKENRLVGILGANGSGKTTLLKAICGILPHKGTCTLNGTMLEPLTARQLAKQVSYIPQRSGISIDISVLDVVLMGFNPQLKLLEYPSEGMRREALAALERVGLRERAGDNYMHLSEGQKQLCILARTLVSSGKLLLLDEPESALDFRYRHNMLAIIKSWVKQEDRCAIVTLHDPSLALNFCDELILLQGGMCIGTLRPHEDSCEAMAVKLSALYGPVTLTSCLDKRGKTHIVMLKEEG